MIDFHSCKKHEPIYYKSQQGDYRMYKDECYEMSYLAGVFDGDGSFSLIKKIENINYSPLYFPLIQFGCRDNVLIETLKSKFGGNYTLSKKHVSQEGFLRNDFYRYKLEKSNRCKPFLEKIIPYLKIKKDRAELLLEYINNNPFKRGSNKLSQEILISRERYYYKMKKLNSERSVKSNLRSNPIQICKDEYFLSYISGIMDTDGSFSVNSSGYCPVISLTMVDCRSIEYISGCLGFGNLSVIKAKSCKTGMAYRWECKKLESVKKFLKSITPYLRAKKETAKCLLEFCEKRTPIKHRRGGIPEEEMKLRKYYHEKVKSLNKYGVFKPSLIDLEVLKQDDRGEGESHAERLNEMASES